jgi:hypothetical protein
MRKGEERRRVCEGERAIRRRGGEGGSGGENMGTTEGSR